MKANATWRHMLFVTYRNEDLKWQEQKKQTKKYRSDLFSSYKYALDFDHCICL